jgi:hypothetical protein
MCGRGKPDQFGPEDRTSCEMKRSRRLDAAEPVRFFLPLAFGQKRKIVNREIEIRSRLHHLQEFSAVFFEMRPQRLMAFDDRAQRLF